MPTPFNTTLRQLATLLLALATGLGACGGGDDDTAAAADAGASGGGSVAAAPLVISAASPAALNGTLGLTSAQYEAGSSNETLNTFASTDPYCRVAAYTLTHSGDGKKYYIELSFRKDTRAIGLLKVGDDASFSVLVRLAAPATGVAVDTANRRIGFSNVVMTSTTTSITLNGSLGYPTNVAAENRAACG